MWRYGSGVSYQCDANKVSRDDSHANLGSSGRPFRGARKSVTGRVLPEDGSCAIVVAGDGKWVYDGEEATEEGSGDGVEDHAV